VRVRQPREAQLATLPSALRPPPASLASSETASLALVFGLAHAAVGFALAHLGGSLQQLELAAEFGEVVRCEDLLDSERPILSLALAQLDPI